jgi:hypothetical protein
MWLAACTWARPLHQQVGGDQSVPGHSPSVLRHACASRLPAGLSMGVDWQGGGAITDKRLAWQQNSDETPT